MDNTLQDYQNDMAFRRKIRLQALAILRRSKEAGIPDSEMRIGRNQLQPILDANYHDGKKGLNVNALLDRIYNNANSLFDLNFIVIDGGDIFTRRKAGFALLFRMIACDSKGKFFTCQDISHKLQTINSTSEYNRNDLSEELKTYDVLFLEEFRKEQLKTGFEIQWFMDEILTERSLNKKPTIFTFSNPVAGHGLSEENALSSTAAYGQYMCMLSQLDMKPISKTLRIRVECLHE
jgi:hypothetical protein